ncbi:hypothetical protein ABBQ32_004432 [Trebouxia sp. C0010 RCD-2024]
MSVGGDERRQWLPVSESDTSDLDFTVPESAPAGMWEGFDDKCVKVAEFGTQWPSILTNKFLRKCTDCSPAQTAEAILPCIRWLKTYDHRKDLLSDVLAGTAVGVMAVPQCVSFALMAGLPSVYGLYSAFLPVLAYALTGSSPQLAVGPVALVSLLLSEGLTKAIPSAEVNANPNQPADPQVQQSYNHAAIQVSLLVSMIYLVLGFLRFGFVTHFLSRPIISAFLTAGTIIISLSQVKYLMGYSVPRANQLHRMLYNLAAGLDGLRWPELLMGLCWIALLLAYRRLQWVGALGPISVAALSITIVYLGDLQHRAGMAVVGSITAGLPHLTIRWWLPMDNFWQLASTAVVISFVSLLESISIARALAEPQQAVLHPLNPNQELMGLGWANLAGAAFNSYPTTGSFARSAVAKYTGARSGLAGVVTAGLVGITLLCLTPVFNAMPMNALAAIVIAGVLPLLDFGKGISLFWISKQDWLVWMVVFLGCLFVGIDWGLAFGVGLAVLVQLGHITFPRLQVLGRIPGTASFRDAEQYTQAETVKGLLILRVNGPVCFANVEHIKECMAQHEAETLLREEPLQQILLDMGGASHVDTTALDAMQEWREGYETRSISFGLVDPNPNVIQIVHKAWGHEKGRQVLFSSVQAALLVHDRRAALEC